MAFVVTYSGALGPYCRAFTARETAERWARHFVDATVYESDCIRFYRCRAYSGKLQLFPAAESVTCGHFVNARHFEQLMTAWTGCTGKNNPRYVYDEYVEGCELDDTITGHEGAAMIHDFRNERPELARQEFAA